MENEFNLDLSAGMLPSKEDILAKISEEEMGTHYGCPLGKKLFCSPLRQDKFATCQIYRSKRNGRLIYKDFGVPDDKGDIFWFVQRMYNCSFLEALRIIANDFGLIKSELPKNTSKIEYKGEKVSISPPTIIKCEIQDFRPQELEWGAQFGISKETLEHFNIFSIKNVGLNGNLFSLFHESQLIFGYYGGIDENGIEKGRIYMPSKNGEKKKFKFINNWSSSMIQGLAQMPRKGDTLFIQKSLKDCAAMYELGYTAIAPNSENTQLPDPLLEALKKRYNRIIYFGDNDAPGIAALASMASKHPELEYFHFPEGYPKDLSDYIKKYGKDKAKDYLEQEFFNG